MIRPISWQFSQLAARIRRVSVVQLLTSNVDCQATELSCSISPPSSLTLSPSSSVTVKDCVLGLHLTATRCHLPYGISVTCHPTQVNTPRYNPARHASTWFTCLGGMEGWVDLVTYQDGLAVHRRSPIQVLTWQRTAGVIAQAYEPGAGGWEAVKVIFGQSLIFQAVVSSQKGEIYLFNEENGVQVPTIRKIYDFFFKIRTQARKPGAGEAVALSTKLLGEQLIHPTPQFFSLTYS